MELGGLGALAALKELAVLAVEVVVALGVPPAPTIPRVSKSRRGAWREGFEGNREVTSDQRNSVSSSELETNWLVSTCNASQEWVNLQLFSSIFNDVLSLPTSISSSSFTCISVSRSGPLPFTGFVPFAPFVLLACIQLVLHDAKMIAYDY